ncbi:Paraquat-inducible protein B [Klebsiella michiganensis]|uniref:Paraquat-inducible protein B n=1 Tax=Klebsiella michiganensis TaxID=1134687 RepID=A0A7H4PK93_9ENTR|nr:Paraquat-inducible protein B [Klebsiella michiganensis]
MFWAEGGAKVQLNGSGLTVQASPLSRALKGAISFDNLSGASASARIDNKRVLYASETAARAVGGQITLHAFDAGKIAEGMPIRYLGIDIGQIQSLNLITAKNEVQAKAVLYPEYVNTFARAGDAFLGDYAADIRGGRRTSGYPFPGLYQRRAGTRCAAP